MAITLLVAGKKFDGWLNVEVSTSMDSIAGKFDVEVALSDATALPIRLRQSVKIFVDNTQVIDGFVESIRGNYSAGNDTLSFGGRDRTADVIDSQLGANPDIKGAISFVDVIKKVLEFGNITDIGVINNVPGLQDFTQSDVIAIQAGQNIFELLNDYAAKRQVFMITDGKANIIINRDTTEKINTPIVHSVAIDKANLSNNVIRANFSYDDTRRYRKYQTISQDNVSVSANITLKEAEDETIKSVVFKKGEVIDSLIRTTRTMVNKAEKPMNDEECKERSLWQLAIARARSLNYQATLNGHSHADGIWRPNRLVKISDGRADLSGDFMINSVTYMTDIDSGNTTSINVVDSNRYRLIAEESRFSRAVNKQGENIVLTAAERTGEIFGGLTDEQLAQANIPVEDS
jgi:prophage tail gpP-like protein